MTIAVKITLQCAFAHTTGTQGMIPAFVRTLSLTAAISLLAGCESIPLPFGGNNSFLTDSEEQQAQRELSRAEKISQGLSEELDWFPSLEQPLQQLEGIYASEQSVSARTQTLSSLAYLYDARLFVLFQDMLDFLPPDARTQELANQNTWLDQRETLATRAFLSIKDADQARLAAGQAFIDATRARIEEIEARRKLVVPQS